MPSLTTLSPSWLWFPSNVRMPTGKGQCFHFLALFRWKQCQAEPKPYVFIPSS